MFEQMPSFDGEKGSERLVEAIKDEKRRTTQLLPLKLKTRIITPQSNDSFLQLLLKPAKLKSEIRRENEDVELIQMKTLASMIPDEILIHHQNQTIRNFEAAIMITDASGFTDLSDKYNKMGKGGASMLSAVLNSYMGTMVQEILHQGGDVLKFSGDAVLTIFKVTKTTSMHDAVHKALDTALIIQNRCGRYKTDVGVILKSKIAISAGDVSFSMIGTEQYSHYVLVGQPLWDTKSCEQEAQSGQVLVTSQAWRYINAMEYSFEYLRDKNLYNLMGFRDGWRFVQQQHDDRLVELEEIDTLLDHRDSGDNKSRDLLLQEHMHSEFLERPSMKIALNKRIRPLLKRFMIPTLNKAIEMNEPIEHLNEMRQVVIVFVNLVTDDIGDSQLIDVANGTFKEICKIAEFYEGTLNKVSLFDKDMMFLIIFGLRGFKHHVQSQIALRCGSEIKSTLINHKHVTTASVGVTTGDTYCGVVGYEKRREYSAISVTVNKAARLMMAYPNKVTCDKETYIGSNLSSVHFTPQKPKELKGLHNVGVVYEFLEVSLHPIQKEPRQLSFTLLGRNDFLTAYDKRLKHAIQLSNDSKHKIHEKYRQISVLITGETREGKSCLLDEMFLHTHKQGLNCFKIKTHVNNAKNPYSLTFLYMTHIMGLKKDSTSIEREKLIFELLEEYEIKQLYFALNPIMNVHFEIPPLTQEIQDKYDEIQRRIFKLLCRKVIDRFWIVFIDDIEFADEESILLLNQVFEVFQIFFVITTGNKRKMSSDAAKTLKQFNVKPLILGPIDRVFQKTLACQFLKVDALDIDIERVINLNSNGNPGWIKRFLTSMKLDGVINIVEMSVQQAKQRGYVFSDAKLNETSNNINALEFCTVLRDFMDDPDDAFATEVSNIKKIIQVATVPEQFRIEDIEIEVTEDVHIMIQYDSLSSFEQQIVKCCSVLGRTFLRSMMSHLFRGNDRKISLAIQHLFELRIFTCAGGNFIHGNVIIQRQSKLTDIDDVTCVCAHLKISENCVDLPRYANCGYMKFKSEYFMKASYDLLTDQQRKEYHINALTYLEKESKRCEACGGSYFESLEYIRGDILPENEIRIMPNVIFEHERVDRWNLEYCSSITQSMESYKSYNMGSPTFFERYAKSSCDKALVFQFKKFTYANCECNMILYLTFAEMVRHAKGANSQQKIVETMMQKAGVCIDVGNYTRALTILDELEAFITTKYEFKKHEHFIYFKSRFYTLQAVANLNLNQLATARDLLKKSCDMLKLKFPYKNQRNVQEALNLANKTKIFLSHYPYGARTRKVTLIYELITIQIAECSSAMFALFKKTKEHDLSMVMASIALYKAVKYSHDYSFIINCYANFLNVGSKLGIIPKVRWMQVRAFELAIYTLKESVDQKLLHSISNLFYALVFSINDAPDKEFAINLGYMNLQINKCSKPGPDLWKILPMLVSLLLTQKRIADIIVLMQQYYDSIKQNDDRTGLTWYYVLCMDILLDTSYTIAPFHKCNTFYMKNSELLSCLEDPFAITRFYANMWLWSVRTKSWASSHIFYEKVQETFNLCKDDSSTNILTSLRVLEGLILTLIISTETRFEKSFSIKAKFIKILHLRNIPLIEAGEIEIRQLMKSIEEALVNKNYHLERYVLLRTYFSQVTNYHLLNQNLLILETVASNCLNSGNFYVHEMIYHNIRAWCKTLPVEFENFWMSFCQDPNKCYSFDEWTKLNHKLFPFTLPMPKMIYS